MCFSAQSKTHNQLGGERERKREEDGDKGDTLFFRSAHFHLLSFFFFIFFLFSNTFHLFCMFSLCCSKTTSSDLQAWLPPKMEPNLPSVSAKEEPQTLQKTQRPSNCVVLELALKQIWIFLYLLF